MRLSPILAGYIGRHFLNAFLGVLAAICGLILLFDVIELLRRTASRANVELDTVATMALMKLPQMLHVVMPFAVMIGAMIAFWRLTRSAELVVARAAGVSVWQLLHPVAGIVLVVGILDVAAFNPLAAALYSRYERMEDALALRHSNPLTVSAGGLWLREADDKGQVVVHAGRVRQQAAELRLRELSIFHLDFDDRFQYRLDAAEGRLAGGWFDLEDVWLMHPGRPSRHFDTYRIRTNLTLDKIQDNFASPEAISFWQLPAFIDFFENAGFSAHRQRLYWHSLMASPFLLVGMALIAAVFSLKPNLRSGGLLGRVVGGAVAGFLCYFFSKVVYAMGLSATLPLPLAAWSPAAVIGLAGLATLFHLEDG
ncbi:MAG: LPS export ABC transporter permease LptG [Alphaproteobacteria bacterium]|nr:LPS export ABC transporter permease LptG [Alphaproteobacteria bacterium]